MVKSDGFDCHGVNELTSMRLSYKGSSSRKSLLCDLLSFKINMVQTTRLYNLLSQCYLVDTSGQFRSVYVRVGVEGDLMVDSF